MHAVQEIFRNGTNTRTYTQLKCQNKIIHNSRELLYCLVMMIRWCERFCEITYNYSLCSKCLSGKYTRITTITRHSVY